MVNMTTFVSGNVSLIQEQLYFQQDAKFNLIKVDNERLYQDNEFVPCVNVLCSNNEFANWVLNDPQNTLFGTRFPNSLPMLLFLNKREGDTVVFTYNDVECHLTLNQSRIVYQQQFDILLKSQIQHVLKKANEPDEYSIANASRCRDPGTKLFIEYAFKAEIEQLSQTFA